MNTSKSLSGWRPTRTTLIASVLVVAGLLLTSVNWWFLLLCAVGSFGPGVLRELGWLHDQDEYQMQANHRAGYHAFVATGCVAFLLVAVVRSGAGTLGDPQELATLFLCLLWFTWLFSSLVNYWGAQAAAKRILIGFGGVWLFFTIASNVGSEWTGWTALLLHPLLAVPFFALAWLSGRWPRVSGCLLLAASVFFARFFGFFSLSSLANVNQAVVLILFVGPLFASGIALLGVRPKSAEADDDG